MSRRPADLEPDTQDDGPGAPSAASAHGAADAARSTPGPTRRGRSHPGRSVPCSAMAAPRSGRYHRGRPTSGAPEAELAVAALGALGGARAGRGRVPRQQPGQPQLVEGRAHLLTVREPGAGRQRRSIEFNKSTGTINGVFEAPRNGKEEFTSSGPKDDLPQSMLDTLQEENVDLEYVDSSSNIWGDILIYALPFLLLIGVARLDEPARAGPDGRGDEHRAQPGQGLQHREAEDDVHRRRRLRPGEAGDRRGRRLPEEPGQVQGDRRAHPEGRAARRPARHRQDAHRPRGRRRGGRAVRVGHRLRLHGDVRRGRRGACARPLPDREEAGARDHLRRRDRLDRPQARRRPRRRPRRARADAQPDARRDGRVRGHRGHRDDGGHQPPRRARPRAPPPRPLRPPDHGAAPHPGRAGRDPQGALPRQEDRRRRRRRRGRTGHARACRAPTSPTS